MSSDGDRHVLPEVSSEDRMHELSEDCWCDPGVVVGFLMGDRTIVHRPEEGQ